MATVTDFYDLIKPTANENYSVDVFNGNMDKIANGMEEIRSSVEASTPVVLFYNSKFETGTVTADNFDGVVSTKEGSKTIYSVKDIELTAQNITDWSAFKYVDIFYRSAYMGLPAVHEFKRVYRPFSSDSNACKKITLSVRVTGNSATVANTKKLYEDIREYLYQESVASGVTKHLLTCVTWAQGTCNTGASMPYKIRGAENMLTVYRIVGNI